MAYATLAGFVAHWPSKASETHRVLLEKFKWVREAENDRFLKQRRIAMGQLAVSLAVDA